MEARPFSPPRPQQLLGGPAKPAHFAAKSQTVIYLCKPVATLARRSLRLPTGPREIFTATRCRFGARCQRLTTNSSCQKGYNGKPTRTFVLRSDGATGLDLLPQTLLG